MLVSCLPLSSRWDLTKRPSCIDEAAYYTAALATDVITDGKSSYLELACSDANLTVSLLGLILLIPIYKVHKLQMPVKRKLAVIGIFALGALVTITGIIRLHYSVRSFASPPFALSSISRKTRSKNRELISRALTSRHRQLLRRRLLVHHRIKRRYPECMSTDTTPTIRRLSYQLVHVYVLIHLHSRPIKNPVPR